MRKLKKLIRQPGVFFRDYLNKRYPVRNAEQRTTESDEPAIIDNSLYLAGLENSINLPPIKVDVVFTWVNNQDPKWQQRRCQYSPTAEQNALHNNDEARFSNHNEFTIHFTACVPSCRGSTISTSLPTTNAPIGSILPTIPTSA